MIALTTDLRYVLEECKDNDYTKIIDEINRLSPKGLRGDNRFIGNCLYVLASNYCTDETIPYKLREQFQEFVFDNYRVNGLLDQVLDVELFIK